MPASVTVNVPIFDFGAQMSTTRARLAKYQAERARLSSVADDVTFEIVNDLPKHLRPEPEYSLSPARSRESRSGSAGHRIAAARGNFPAPDRD